jgi:predicted Zn finger-like uncharacterized protein
MSMLTCCPACATTFKVVPDQLRISQGWVRCGHCTEVFDATEHLQDLDGESTLPSELFAAASQAPSPSAPNGASAESALLAEALAFAESNGRRKATDTSDTPEEPYPAFTLLRADEGPAEADDDLQATPGDTTGLSYRAKPVVVPVPAPAAVRAEVDTDTDSEGAPLSFVQEARRRDFWRRAGVRNGLVLALGLLTVLLAGQYAIHDRDRLASRFPAFGAPLQALCRVGGCTVGAPRQIDAIVIDSSTFNKLRGGDAYRLSLTLKNTAPMAVAMPAVELTLTDAQDQPLLRRVLSAADLGATSAVLPARAEWSGALSLSTPNDSDAARISGYRVLAFYP